MKAYYSFDILGKMRRSKPALTVIYENEKSMPKRSYRNLFNCYKTFYERSQTDYEKECASDFYRQFSLYTYFFKDFKTTDDVCEQCIKDDKYLCNNEDAANTFRKQYYEALNEYGHAKKSKNKHQLKIEL